MPTAFSQLKICSSYSPRKSKFAEFGSVKLQYWDDGSRRHFIAAFHRRTRIVLGLCELVNFAFPPSSRSSDVLAFILPAFTSFSHGRIFSLSS